MSSQYSISMASSRQFEHIQQRTRIAIPSDQIAPTETDNIKSNTPKVDEVTVTLSAEQNIQINLLSRMFGKRIELPELNLNKTVAQDLEIEQSQIEQPQVQTAPDLVLSQNYLYEHESTIFEASGTLTLSNGNETSFYYQVSYQREYESYSEQLLSQQKLQDPIVINLGTDALSLSSDKISFDLNMDGKLDQIASLTGQAGFIGLDKNNNGVIDDGTELFGAITGNGFMELAQYDDNQDGVINSNDAVFSQLMVWQPQNNSLFSLKDSEVDTLVLASVATNFSFTDSNNERLGQMRQSSIYANQDGSVGGLHQIDLVI